MTAPPPSLAPSAGKRCSRCRKERTLEDFHPDPYPAAGDGTGVMLVCRLCAADICDDFIESGGKLHVPRERRGTYYPATQSGSGDVALFLLGAEIWRDLGFGYPVAPTDAVTVTCREGERVRVRLVARDLFTGHPLITELDPNTGRPFDLE